MMYRFNLSLPVVVKFLLLGLSGLILMGIRYSGSGMSGFILNAQETKLLITQTACVDIPKIMNVVNQSPEMQDFLLSTEKNYQEEAKTVQRKINELEDFLKRNEGTLSRSQTKEITKEIEFQRLELNQIILTDSTGTSDEEIILKGIYRLIKEIAELDGLSIIIEKSSSVIYNKPEVDITDKVIKIMSGHNDEDESE